MLKIKFNDPQLPPVELTSTRLTIGRDKTNDLVLTDTTISGFHAEIQTEDDRSYLVDLGSANGTFIGGKKISGRQEIKAWDVISFGTVEAEVVDPDKRRPTTVMKAISDADLDRGSQATTVRPAVSGWSMTGTADPVKGKVFPLGTKMILGRDPDCDIVIDSSGVSGRHAQLEEKAGSLQVKDLSSTNGTYVAGKKVNEALLNNGDELRLDEVGFKIQGPRGDIAKTMVRPAVGVAKTQVNKAVGGTQVMASVAGTRLVGRGIFSGKTFTLAGTVMTVGRTEENDIRLDEATVSSKHARLVAAGGGWKLEDAGSQNGTSIGGNRVGNQQLKDGDVICFGKAELCYENPAEQPTKTGTRVMGSVGAETVTSVMPSAKKTIPAWAWGAGGFGLVALGFIIFLFVRSGGGGSIVDAKVQGGSVWEQQLSDGRKGPATPVLADVNGDGMLDVVVGDANGYLTALDGEKGLKIFTSMAADKILAPPVAVQLSNGSPMDIVAATNGGLVKAYNGEGNVLWTSPGDLNMGEILNRPVYQDLNGDKIPDVIIPTAKRGLVALDGSRGWEVWNTAEIFKGKIINAPVKADINNDGLSDYVGITESGHVAAVTSKDGKVWKLWETQLPGTFYGSPTFLKAGKQGLIIVPTNKQGIMAIDGTSGRIAWSSNLAKQFFASPVATDANGDKVEDVALIALNGDIHILDGRNGDEIWSMALGAQVQASPALFDVNGDRLEDLIVLDGNSNVQVIDMNRGKILLTLNVAGAGGFTASPVLGDVNGDGLLDVVTAGQSGKITTLFLNRAIKKSSRIWPEFLGGL